MNEKYESLYLQTKGVIDDSLPLVSNLSNVTAILKQLDDINWCGFYLINKDYLYLGPFQGDVACNKIPFTKGVCGYSYTNKKTVIVPNVQEFKGHIACSSISKSEIVTPIIKNDKVVGLIDIDSPIYDRFHDQEQELLEKIAALLSPLFE